MDSSSTPPSSTSSVSAWSPDDTSNLSPVAQDFVAPIDVASSNDNGHLASDVNLYRSRCLVLEALLAKKRRDLRSQQDLNRDQAHQLSVMHAERAAADLLAKGIAHMVKDLAEEARGPGVRIEAIENIRMFLDELQSHTYNRELRDVDADDS
jgi:hypothetical protein